MKLNVAGESGPRTTPAAVCDSSWNGPRMSEASPGRDPVIPLGVIAIAGTCRRSDRLLAINSETDGANNPAEEMTSNALGVETWR